MKANLLTALQAGKFKVGQLHLVRSFLLAGNSTEVQGSGHPWQEGLSVPTQVSLLMKAIAH